MREGTRWSHSTERRIAGEDAAVQVLLDRQAWPRGLRKAIWVLGCTSAEGLASEPAAVGLVAAVVVGLQEGPSKANCCMRNAACGVKLTGILVKEVARWVGM